VTEIKSKGGTADRKQLLNGKRHARFWDLNLTLSDLDDEIDTVNVQNDLRESLMSSSINGGATNLDSRPTFRQLFVDLAQQLVGGIALDIEGLVDVLTLKNNVGLTSGDAATALRRLVKDIVNPFSWKSSTHS
jgi:hypothetical protein